MGIEVTIRAESADELTSYLNALGGRHIGRAIMSATDLPTPELAGHHVPSTAHLPAPATPRGRARPRPTEEVPAPTPTADPVVTTPAALPVAAEAVVEEPEAGEALVVTRGQLSDLMGKLLSSGKVTAADIQQVIKRVTGLGTAKEANDDQRSALFTALKTEWPGVL